MNLKQNEKDKLDAMNQRRQKERENELLLHLAAGAMNGFIASDQNGKLDACVITDMAFDQAEDMMAEAKKRGILP